MTYEKEDVRTILREQAIYELQMRSVPMPTLDQARVEADKTVDGKPYWHKFVAPTLRFLLEK